MFGLLSFTLFIVACTGIPCDDDVKQRLCQKGDKNCVREYFSKHSCCIPVRKEPKCNEYDMPSVDAHLLHANTTIRCRGAKVCGINDVDVLDMYISKHNLLILVIEYKKLVTYGPKIGAKYHICGQAPIELEGHLSITYSNMHQTITIPLDDKNNMIWKKREVYSCFSNTDFCPSVGEGLTNSNPQVQACFKEWTTNLRLSVLEASLYKGPIYFDLYMENNVCKF